MLAKHQALLLDNKSKGIQGKKKSSNNSEFCVRQYILSVSFRFLDMGSQKMAWGCGFFWWGVLRGHC